MDCSQLGYKSGEMTLVGSNLILVKVKSLMQDLNQQLSIRRNEPGEFTTSAFSKQILVYVNRCPRTLTRVVDTGKCG